MRIELKQTSLSSDIINILIDERQNPSPSTIKEATEDRTKSLECLGILYNKDSS